MKGAYVLYVELKKDQKVKIGKLRKINFSAGTYAYIGSAMNSLEKRIERHKRQNKKLHWHIDYLLKYGKITAVKTIESETKNECEVAKKFWKYSSIKNFGSSDCKCKSHLFFINGS